MGNYHKLVLTLFLFLTACGEGPDQKQNKHDRLKEGSDLFAQYGCIACHSLDGNKMYGPPLGDIFLKEVTVIRQGELMTIVADRKYFKRSILDPGFEKDSGYQNKTMPQPDISGGDVNILVDYLIALD